MLNYIKSEWYRISHTKGIYMFLGVFMILAVLMNVGIDLFGNQYATTAFSYSNFVANPMVFPFMGIVIAYFLYDGSRKNGNLKNTIASGISRVKIFAGECVVGILVSTLMMILILGTWILCAQLLLESKGVVQLDDVLWELPSIYLISIASLISSILMIELFEKSINGILAWFAIWFLIPEILRYLGLRFDWIQQIALWLPNNFFKVVNGAHVNMQECITMWETTEGFLTCILAGLMGVILFTSLGIYLLKERDL